ncbi:MAG: hypothetical protein AB7L91_18630 [Dehalococcoidia bacterium]
MNADSARAEALRVAAALDELADRYTDASALPKRTDSEHAHRAARLALVCARRAGWWRVLERRAYRDPGTPSIYGHAALMARHREQDNARFWRQSAADWAARAAGDRHGSGLWATWDHLTPADHDPVRDEHGAVA